MTSKPGVNSKRTLAVVAEATVRAKISRHA
jgi:hypothetical protein